MPEITGILSSNPNLVEDFVSQYTNLILPDKKIAISVENKNIGTYFSGHHLKEYWIAIGVGIKNSNNIFKIMDKYDWDNVYKSGIVPKNGHFIFVKWDGVKLEIANDPFGIRDLFYIKDSDKIVFSTKIEYLLDIKKYTTINIDAIAADFILNERLSYDSEIKEIHRLGPDAKAIFKPELIKIRKNDTFITPNKENDNNINGYFRNILSVSSNKTLSLGLSGGVDSRILLAFLLSEHINFTTHSFGSAENKDIIVADLIARKIGFEHNIFSYYNKDEMIEHIVEFLSYNPFNVGFERAPYYSFYSEQGKNHIVIDGAFGEFVRRDYYKKLRYLERFGKLNPSAIYKSLKITIPYIFRKDVMRRMEKSATLQVLNVYDEYTERYKNKLGFDDFLALKYHFPNKMGRDQARIDRYCMSFMPFAQSVLIEKLLFPKRKTVDERIIDRLYKPLAQFSFVKDDRYYPFNKNIKTLIKLKEKLFKKRVKREQKIIFLSPGNLKTTLWMK